MYIKELKVGTDITIKSVGLNNELEFKTKIVHKYKDKVVLNPVFVNGKQINFMSPLVKTNIIYIKDSIEYIFKEAFIVNSYKYKNLLLPEVSENLYGERVNRRSTPRFSLNKECIFTPGNHRLAGDAYIKDISIEGISITSNLDACIGDEVTISFRKRHDDKQHITIKAEVARILEDNTDKSKNIYGCKITKCSSIYNKYVMEVQRDRIKVKT